MTDCLDEISTQERHRVCCNANQHQQGPNFSGVRIRPSEPLLPSAVGHLYMANCCEAPSHCISDPCWYYSQVFYGITLFEVSPQHAIVSFGINFCKVNCSFAFCFMFLTSLGSFEL